jgi:hypothetical protein
MAGRGGVKQRCWGRYGGGIVVAIKLQSGISKEARNEEMVLAFFVVEGSVLTIIAVIGVCVSAEWVSDVGG